jgi:uncharacterized protein HemX
MKTWRYPVAALVLALSAGAGFFGFNLFQHAQYARAEQQVEATREQLAQVEDLADVFRKVSDCPSIWTSSARSCLTATATGNRICPKDFTASRRRSNSARAAA